MLVSASRATPLPNDQLHMGAENRGYKHIVQALKGAPLARRKRTPVRLVPLQTFRPLDVCFCIVGPEAKFGAGAQYRRMISR